NVESAGQLLRAPEVCGDFIRFIEAPGGVIWACIGDVSGKGVVAALMSSSIVELFIGEAPRAESVEQLSAVMNRMFVGTHYTVGKFVMCAIMRVDTRSMELTYCVAGHEPPI